MFNLLSLACKLHNNLLSLTNFSFKKKIRNKVLSTANTKMANETESDG